MNYIEFEKYITTLKACSDKLDKVSDIMDCDFFAELVGPIMDTTIDLLESHFNDKSHWISYWMYDLDFGKLYKPGKVKIADEDVPLKTIEDLYDVIRVGV